MTDQTTTERAAEARVVGVGASAGGLDACKRLLATLPADSGLALAIVLHLDPSQPSHLAEVLATESPAPVVAVAEPVRIAPNHVYVIVPGASLELDGELLRPGPLPARDAHDGAVDRLFRSLAAARGPRATAVVLSGLGSDGAAGIREVGAAGGLCIAQEPSSAEHDSMPQSAIATGRVDAILAPEQIIDFVLSQPELRDPADGFSPDGGFSAVLELLAAEHGLAYRDYKRGTLRRRADRRLVKAGCASWAEYRAYLEGHPDELAALYDDVLIGVTEFFRDPEQWDHLAGEVVPRMLDGRDPAAGPVRVWSAGCATGEEAYGLAMILLEQLGQLDAGGRGEQVQVFATDLSQRAISFARRASYPASIAEQVSPARLARFFAERDGGYQVDRAVRDCVTFARHDLLVEPPLSRMDLIACRNVLIYLEPHAQANCLERLHFALNRGGILWLGSAESSNRQTDLFTPLSSKYRIFKKAEASRLAAPWTAWPGGVERVPPLSAARTMVPAPVRSAGRRTRALEQYVLERHTKACAVINEAGSVLHLFGPTECFLTPPSGELRLELLAWVDDSAIYARLRPALERALARRERAAAVVEPTGGVGGPRIAITIEPIPTVAEGLYLVVFDACEPAREHAEGPDAAAGRASLEDPVARRLAAQLHETQDELHGALEQLDTANEEYRTSYEELVSLNEELRSSNEELETTREEAQSLNEELLTLNRELEQRNELLHTTNAELESVLGLTTIPTVLLDGELRLRRFTPAAERVLWLTPSDVGRPIDQLRARVDDPQLLADVRRVLAEQRTLEAEVRDDAGRWYRRRAVSFGADELVEGVCLIFYDISAEKLADEQRAEARHFAGAIVQVARAPFAVFDDRLRVVAVNDALFDGFGLAEAVPDGGGPAELEGLALRELGEGEWEVPPLREQLERLLVDKAELRDFEFDQELPGLGRRRLRVNASLLERVGRTPLILTAFEDLTELREAQEQAQQRTRELEQEHRRKDEFLAMLGHELRNPLAALVNGLALLEQVGDDADQRARIQAILSRQTRRITVMLDQLLDISRVSSGKIQLVERDVDLVEVAHAALEAVEPLRAAADHELTVELPDPGEVRVRGDLVRLIQVVENLLTNAIKYTDDGGHIRLVIDQADHCARICVSDDGVGIDAELLPRIFEVFAQGSQSLARSKGGLGLGLSLVRQLVEMHGGCVEARSDGPGRGSEFEVRLPLLGHATVVGERERERVELDAVPARRVLIVDDELDTATTLAELLEGHGHTTHVAHDGRGAIAAVPEFDPDVVLLALGLPDLDGYAVARSLRESFGPTPRIVALTGFQRDAQRLHAAGFDDHVIKPPSERRLAAALAGAGGI